jgi:hypothetical protein
MGTVSYRRKGYKRVVQQGVIKCEDGVETRFFTGFGACRRQTDDTAGASEASWGVPTPGGDAGVEKGRLE